jgi:deazaflavin-dependent oxidoreductase (nitroreductase family)
MDAPQHTDPAESGFLRWFYRGWRPTRLGMWANRAQGWLAGMGMPPAYQVLLETRGRSSGRRRSTPIVIATVDGVEYLVSMLGPRSAWVKNVEAASGRAVLKHGKRRRVRLEPVPVGARAPVLKEYVRVAKSGRRHFPVSPDAPLSAFEEIAARYPVYRIEAVTAVPA